MDHRTRKLGVAAVCLALFAGFVALTKWTGDDPDSVASLDDAEQDELRSFCFVFSSEFIPYEMVLRGAAGAQLSGEESSQLPGQGNVIGMALDQLSILADQVPEQYAADAQLASEGLERALDGDLDPDEADEYIASYERLQAEAAEDCDQIEDLEGVEGIGGFEE